MPQIGLLSIDSLSFSFLPNLTCSTQGFFFFYPGVCLHVILKSGIYYIDGYVAGAGSKNMGKEKERVGEQCSEFLRVRFSEINTDSQAVSAPAVAGLLAP